MVALRVTPATSDGSVGIASDQTAACARALGIAVPLGERFPCVLPDHQHEARLHPAPGGFWQHRCRDGDRSYGLAEVRACQAYGEIRRISRVEAARWRERLLHDAGLSERGPLEIHSPPGFPEGAKPVLLGLGLFLGVRDPLWDGQPFTFARRFAMAYCGVTDEQARRGVEALRRCGVIEVVGKLRCNGYPTNLWRLVELGGSA